MFATARWKKSKDSLRDLAKARLIGQKLLINGKPIPIIKPNTIDYESRKISSIS